MSLSEKENREVRGSNNGNKNWAEAIAKYEKKVRLANNKSLNFYSACY